MLRQRTTSAPVRYVRPTLEALEDRTMPDATSPTAAFADLMHNFAHSALSHNSDTMHFGAIAANEAFSDLATHPGNVQSIVPIVAGAAALQVQANTMAAQADAFIGYLQAGANAGLIAPNDLGRLLDDAIQMKTIAVQDQIDATIALGQAFGALSPLFGPTPDHIGASSVDFQDIANGAVTIF